MPTEHQASCFTHKGSSKRTKPRICILDPTSFPLRLHMLCTWAGRTCHLWCISCWGSHLLHLVCTASLDDMKANANVQADTWQRAATPRPRAAAARQRRPRPRPDLGPRARTPPEPACCSARIASSRQPPDGSSPAPCEPNLMCAPF